MENHFKRFRAALNEVETGCIKVTEEGTERDKAINSGDIQEQNQHHLKIILEYKENLDETVEDELHAPCF